MGSFADLAKKTPRQKALSTVHHLDTTQYDLAHAQTHMNEDDPKMREANVAHAQKHLDDAKVHASALTDLVAQEPNLAPHAMALRTAVRRASQAMPPTRPLKGKG